MRLRGQERDHVRKREFFMGRRRGPRCSPARSVHRREGDFGMSKAELKTMAKIAFVAAVVAIAVQHFIEPAAKSAVKAK